MVDSGRIGHIHDTELYRQDPVVQCLFAKSLELQSLVTRAGDSCRRQRMVLAVFPAANGPPAGTCLDRGP